LEEIWSNTTNQATLQNYLRDTDPAVASAAFDVLEKQNHHAAMKALLDVVNDPGEPVRLQAFQLLLSSAEAGETPVATLRAALQDPDPAFVAGAVQALAERNDAEALSALAEALRTRDLSTRLLIVRSVASNTAAVPLLYQALIDPDETVHNAATSVLSGSSDQ
jgi:HEAT repeat protein